MAAPVAKREALLSTPPPRAARQLAGVALRFVPAVPLGLNIFISKLAALMLVVGH
jgi:hypothetical protein